MELINGNGEPPIKIDPRDTPSVRFTKEQTVEIMMEDYSLKLFHLTRIKPLSLNEIKQYAPEPDSGRASDIMDRFCAVGLIDVTSDHKYYSKYPNNFANFTEHPLDKEIEADKDSLIFDLMKEKVGDEIFWKKNTFFQEDGYFTNEQTNYIREALLSLKFYVKKALQENRERGLIEGLTYRRHKFYDIGLSLLFVFVFLISSNRASAGNDPGGAIWMEAQAKFNIAPLTVEELTEGMRWSKENMMQDWVDMDGNDPGVLRVVRAWDSEEYIMRAIPGPLTAKQDVPTFYACHNDVVSSEGYLPSLQMGCLNMVKKATTDVCASFGDQQFCGVAKKSQMTIDFLKQ
ncbi:MAG: hypothetical protein H6623_01755 [Bdellovibrionaceae bacterium]|nr:hypothetical protein [Pseudobdellovibrionaceae bacterium]